MLFRVLAVSGLALVASVAGVQAQGLAGPRELPPPGFSGQQYVDSRGCVFLRGGVAGTTTWVPRVSANRRQLCGFPPSFTPAPAAVAEAPRAASPAPAPAPVRRAGDPMPTVATTTTPPAIRDTTGRTAIPAARYAAPPVAVAAPAPRVAPPPPAPAPAAAPVHIAQAAPVTAGCPAHAPYGERLLTTDGRSALLCVASPEGIPDFARRLGATAGRVPQPAPQPVAAAPRVDPAPVARVAAAPVTIAAVEPSAPVGARYFPDGRIACPSTHPVAQSFPLRGGGSTVLCTTGGGGMATAVAGYTATGATAAPVSVPRGYRLAWTDDRLNPRRGLGTAAGQAAQDGVWTREVPARLVAEVEAKRPRVTVSTSSAPTRAAPAVTHSTASAPRAAAPASGRFLVQVGSFGVPANAEGARGRLAGLGLPVATGRGSIKGKAVQVVHAGPFATEAEARRALAAARGAGFADAFIR